MPNPYRSMELDEALANAGSLGSFQGFIFSLLFIAGAFHGARMTFSYFIHFQPEYRCAIPGWFNDTFGKGDYSHQVAVNKTVPVDDSCHVYKVNATFDLDKYHRPINATDQDVQGCPNGWVYDTSHMVVSPTSQFDLVCHHANLVSYIVMAVMAGSLVGALFFGWISDKFGRKICFHTCLLLSFATGAALTWAPDVAAFSVLVTLAAAGTSGMFAAALVTAIEFTLPQDRKIPVLAMLLSYPLGELFLSAIAFGLRDWRWMNLTISAPSTLMASYIWFVPESPRWLKVNKQYERLEKVLQKVAKFNKRQIPLQPDGEKQSLAALLESYKEDHIEIRPPEKDSLLNMLLTSRVLCLRSLVTFLNWFVVTFVYYGLILNSANLGTGPLRNFLLGSLVEIPVHFLSLLSVDRDFFASDWIVCAGRFLGRKRVHGFYLALVVVFSALAIVVCLTVAGYHWLVLLFALIGKLGGAGLMGTSFLWMSELYPTSVRGTAIGVMGVFSRLGAMAVPYLIQQSSEKWPFVAFCTLSLLAFLATLTLPETSGRDLPATVREARHFGRQEDFPTPLIAPPRPQAGRLSSVPYGSIESCNG